MSSVGIRQAVVESTQPLDLPESRRGLRIVEEYLAEPETCDEVYEAVADRVHGSLDQVAVLNKCFYLLKKYLLQHPPQSQSLLRIAASCTEAASAVGPEHEGLIQCVAYVRHLVKAALVALGGDVSAMGNKLGRDRKSGAASLATGANEKHSRQASRDSVKAALPPLAPQFVDSAFLHRPSDIWQAAEADSGGGRTSATAPLPALSPNLSVESGRQASIPSNSWLTGPRSAELDERSPSRRLAWQPVGSLPEDLLRVRWLPRTVPDDAGGMASWHSALPHTSLSIFSSAGEAVEAHVAAPTLRVHGDYQYDADSTIAVQLQSPADVQLHLCTVARHQMDQMAGHPNRRPASSKQGGDSEHGKSHSGANLPTRPLFLYRPYDQQERLEMDVIQTAAVVAIVLGPAAAANLLGPQYSSLLGPDLLGNDPWNVPLGKRPQGQAMASILIKLIMDMWLDMPAHESLPLVLSMLQAALEESDEACRTRVFDLLYNLSLHAHVMVPLETSTEDSGSLSSPRSTDAPPVKHLFYRTIEVAEHDSRLPKRVVTFQQWLRCILFQLLLDCVHLDEASEDVWAAGLGCLLHLVCCQGAIMQSALQGLSPTAVAALLRHAHAFAWSLELQSTLMRVASNLMYIHPKQSAAGPPPGRGAPPRLYPTGTLCMHALREFGGVQHVLCCLRAAPTRDARNNMLAVLLDAAAERSALSRDECSRLRYFLADERTISCIIVEVQAGQRGFGEALAATVEPHARAHCDASVPVTAASNLLQTLCSNLEEVVRPGPPSDELERLPHACLSSVEVERGAAWSTLGALLGARDEDSQALAVQSLTETLWRGRLDDVQRGSQQRVQASKHADYSTLKLSDATTLWQVSLLPGPSCSSQLPPDHPLQGFFSMMKAVLGDPDTCTVAANNLVHTLCRLIATFLLNKSVAHPTNPGGVRVTVHHVAVIVATMQGAIDWVLTLPKTIRHVPLLWILHIMLETLAVPQIPPDEPHDIARQTGRLSLEPKPPSSALPPSAASLSPVTQLLQGFIAIPGLVVMSIPPNMLLLLFKHLVPPGNSSHLHQSPAAAAFQGWLAFASPRQSEVAALPAEQPVPHGLAIGLASARDARLAAFLMLLGRCRLDHSALQKVGGCAALYHAMEDEDSRVRYVVADYIIDRVMRHNPARFQAALAEVVGSAQSNNNNDNVVENPYAQLHAFVTRGLISLEDL